MIYPRSWPLWLPAAGQACARPQLSRPFSGINTTGSWALYEQSGEDTHRRGHCYSYCLFWATQFPRPWQIGLGLYVGDKCLVPCEKKKKNALGEKHLYRSCLRKYLTSLEVSENNANECTKNTTKFFQFQKKKLNPWQSWVAATLTTLPESVTNSPSLYQILGLGSSHLHC